MSDDTKRHPHTGQVSEKEYVSRYRSGLRRVASIIDGAGTYDELMRTKLHEADVQAFSKARGIEGLRRVAERISETRIRKSPHRIFTPRSSGLVCEGGSHNNLREFDFFSYLCRDFSDSILEANYSSEPRFSAGTLSDAEQAMLGKMLIALQAYYKERKTLSVSLVHQLVLYSRSFFGFYVSFSRPRAVLPRALVVANDHSPVRVALCMILKAHRVPRIYLQHAEVTENFPPLDFEISILRNSKSLATYEKAGPVTGRTFVVSRHRREFAGAKLAMTRAGDVTAVIYPTSRIHAAGIQGIVRALRVNPDVREILIKEHPGAAVPMVDIIEPGSAEIVSALPERDHIAIVGNSSIAVELLHDGIPVYQNFGFDPVQPDYYGFVAKGITRQVSTSELSTRFWHPYNLDKRWKAGYFELDPSAGSSYGQETRDLTHLLRALTEGKTKPQDFKPRVPKVLSVGAIRKALVAKITGKLGNLARIILRKQGKNKNARPSVDPIPPRQVEQKSPTLQQLAESIRTQLVTETNPAQWLLDVERREPLAPIAIITAIEALHQARNPCLKAVFGTADKWSPGSAAGTWIYLRRSQLNHADIDPHELGEIALFVYTYSGEKNIKARLERLLLSCILQVCDVDQLEEFFKRSQYVKVEKLPVNRQFDVVRKLESSDRHAATALEIYRSLEDSASGYNRLKLSTMRTLQGLAINGWSHRHAEMKFAETASKELTEEYLAFVQPVYDTLRSRSQFMDVRTDAKVRDAFLGKLQTALEGGRPLAMARLSDGEGYLFHPGRFFTQEDTSNRERHWWGVNLSEELRAKIIDECRTAISQVDIVGIPSIYRLIRDHNEASVSITGVLQSRGLVEVLNGIGALASPEAIFTEDKANIALFREVDSVSALARYAERVVIVGSVLPENMPERLTSNLYADHIIIPTHHKTSGNAKYNNAQVPLPFVYGDILEEIDRKSAPGVLVLVAGGILGKIFVARARASGAVALDIGHVLDDWVHTKMAALR